METNLEPDPNHKRLEVTHAGYRTIISMPGEGYVTREVCRMDGSTMSVLNPQKTADRLVRCWNACIGKSDAELEGNLFTEGELVAATTLVRIDEKEKYETLAKHSDTLEARLRYIAEQLEFTPRHDLARLCLQGLDKGDSEAGGK